MIVDSDEVNIKFRIFIKAGKKQLSGSMQVSYSQYKEG